jgi:hypothetical protein
MSDKMNFKKACSCLNLETGEDITHDILKRQYKRRALQVHPDKNSSENAADEFRTVREAYDYLMNYRGYTEDDLYYQNETEENGTSSRRDEYQNILFSFLTPILNSDLFHEIKTRVFYTIIERITSKCESKAIDILEKMDKRAFSKIYEILKMYQDVFHISDEFLRKVEESFAKKTQNDECIILNPFLDDLFENNLYRLVENGEKYVIPLWHHELVYDNKGADLYVRCIPILPDNIDIDENNNIHVRVNCTIDELWMQEFVTVELGKQHVNIPKHQVKMTEYQTILLVGMGISKININDIYDVSKKTDVYVHLTLGCAKLNVK